MRSDSPETSYCLECLSPLQYILDQRSDCRNCPPGLICFGTNVTNKVVAESEWEEDEGLFKLKTCPAGYRRISDEGRWDQQKCEPCDRGSECTTPPCDQCTPCAPGKFKATRSIEPCENCKEDTYNPLSASTSRSDCTSCPPDSDTGGFEGSDSALDCSCKPTTYRGSGSNASLVCQPCPPGLRCFGSESVEPVQPDSSWELRDGVYFLSSCPRGHYVYPQVLEESNANANLQECRPCEGGHQCESDSCVTCSPCPAGFFKDTALPIACRPCPKNTYNQNTGSVSSADCTPCPTGASTEAEAQSSNTCKCSDRFYSSSDTSSCVACPAGAECDDAGLSCAFRFEDQRCPGKTKPIVGTWTRDQDDLFRLDACPSGYERRADSPLTDACIECDKVRPCVCALPQRGA